MTPPVRFRSPVKNLRFVRLQEKRKKDGVDDVPKRESPFASPQRSVGFHFSVGAINIFLIRSVWQADTAKGMRLLRHKNVSSNATNAAHAKIPACNRLRLSNEVSRPTLALSAAIAIFTTRPSTFLSHTCRQVNTAQRFKCKIRHRCPTQPSTPKLEKKSEA